MGTLDKYQEDVKHVFDRYMQLYFDESPKGQTTETAQEFLRKYNDKYREEVNNVALLSFRNNDYDKAVHDKILQLIDHDTRRLHEEITGISRKPR